MRNKKTEFDTFSKALRNDLQSFAKKKERRTDEQLNNLSRRLINLNKIILEMQSSFKKEKDSKEKRQIIIGCQGQYAGLAALLKQTEKQFDEQVRNKLYGGIKAQNPTTALSNQNLMAENLRGFGAIVEDTHEINTQLNAINEQLVEDRTMMNKIGQINDDIKDDTDVTRKMMKRQKNQELLKRLTLVGLAVFLTLSDVVLLILKIT